MRKIALINSKGGVAKTTSSVNLAAGLAANGKKVLILDLDPQGHDGVLFGIKPGEKSMAELIIGQAAPEECFQTVRPNLTGILCDSRLEKAGRILAGESYRETKLKRLMAKVDGFDYVICDCSPGLNLLNQNALMFVDEVFIPVSMEFLSLYGLSELERQLEEAREMSGHDIKIGKIIPTFYDRRNKRSEEILELLKKRFGSIVTAPIRINSRLSEAAATQKTIYEYDPKSPGAEDYSSLTKEVLGNG